MFISLNKKFFLTVLTFCLLTTVIFFTIFNETIGKEIAEEHNSLITRNQYVIELLNENISLRKNLRELQPQDTSPILEKLQQKQEELKREKQLSEELNQNYNEKYEKLSQTLKLISFGAALSLIYLIILLIILRKWVIAPLDKLTVLSIAVANGDFSQRLAYTKSKFSDEFDILMQTLNFMLDNIENNINDIKQKEIFLQNLIDSLPDAVRIIDDEHNIILSNKAYIDYTQKKYLTQANKCFQSYNNNCPCSENQYACPLKELQHKNNIKLIHSIQNKPFFINAATLKINGKPAIIESFRDLSENIHFSHQQKISSLGFLATSLAHEMKNNLGAINLIISGLLQKYYKDKNDDNEEKKYLTLISNQIMECIEVPERLLKLARSNNDENGKFAIQSCILDIVSLLDYEIKSKGITLKTEFIKTNIYLYGNETDFKMIILNLAQNAINAMPQGGTLNIKASSTKDNILIIIKDTGCGIKEADLHHIFEPFYSSSVKKSGTGLGLAIVKDLTSKFNADITVESKENIGSCFTLTFAKQKNKKDL